MLAWHAHKRGVSDCEVFPGTWPLLSWPFPALLLFCILRLWSNTTSHVCRVCPLLKEKTWLCKTCHVACPVARCILLASKYYKVPFGSLWEFGMQPMLRIQQRSPACRFLSRCPIALQTLDSPCCCFVRLSARSVLGKTKRNLQCTNIYWNAKLRRFCLWICTMQVLNHVVSSAVSISGMLFILLRLEGKELLS